MSTFFTWRGVLVGVGRCLGAVSPILGMMLFIAVSNAAVTGMPPDHHHETEHPRSETVISHPPEGSHAKHQPPASDIPAGEQHK